MSLPKLSVPTFNLTIPSTGKTIKYRPFLSKEEKILMLIKESSNPEEIENVVKEVITACTFGEVDVETLASFDIEYIFLQLRSKAVGEVIELDMKCTNVIEEEKIDEETGEVIQKEKRCGNLVSFDINIKDIQVNIPEEHSKTIVFENNIGVTLRYPTSKDTTKIEEIGENDIELMRYLLDNIFDSENVYDVKDTPKEEIDEFFDNIPTKYINKIREQFFINMPRLEYTAKYTCSKCKYEGEYTFVGLSDFF